MKPCQKKRNRACVTSKKAVLVLLLGVLLMSMLTVGVFAADVTFKDQSGVVWEFTGSDETALTMILDSNQTIENAQVLLISDSVQGTAVDAVRSNGFDNVVVGHKANEYILIPNGIKYIGSKTFYDFNFVKSVSIPSSVEVVDYNAFDVLGREINNATVIYGASGSAAESWAGDNSTAVYSFQPVEASNFIASAEGGGYIYPSGSYYVPDGMKDEAVTTYFSAEAAEGFVIDTLSVDGVSVSEAAGQKAYLLHYTFSADSASVTVTFAEDMSAAEVTGEAMSEASEEIELTIGETAVVDYAMGGMAVQLVDGAVAEGVDISDIYDAPQDNAAGYAASMGVSTGDYYIDDGILYEMVFATNGTGDHGDLGVVFQCKAQVINYLYETFGWVYGTDYHRIRMYHFDSTVTGGNRKGSYDFHCAFAYKQVDEDGDYTDLAGTVAFYSKNENTEGISNNSTLFVQGTAEEPATATVNSLYAQNHTRPDGPQEATNFYGIGSAVLVDGGTASMNNYATTLYDESEATTVDLIDPYIVGGANPIYVLATSRVNIQGGIMFTAYSGGHGPYVSLQGQITINADERLIDENGVVNTDVEELKETVLADIPGRFGWAERNTYEDGTPVDANDYSVDHSRLALDEEGIAAYAEENGAVTVVTTANSSGSILVTDSGGGILVANKLSGVAYSTGSSGIYSMGGGSYVYVYNSRLESHIEPAINSVGEGYVFAFNSSFTGPVGILSSGGSDHVQVYNSQITTELDFDMDFYDLTDPNDPEQLVTYETLLEEVEANELVNSNYLMIFPLNGDDMNNFTSNWFVDRTQVPGKNGGNIALISTTSPSGITIDSTKLTNNAYAEYADEGAPNWLVAAAGGTSTINFRNENSKTMWDLTGKDTSTTELYGNIYCAPASGSGMWVTAEGSAIVNLANSEWTGTIENRGDGVTLNLDGSSVWTCTGTCAVNVLTLEEGAVIKSPEGCEIAFYVQDEKIDPAAGTYENIQIVVTKNGGEVYDGLYGPEATEPVVEEETSNAAQAYGEISGASVEASGDMGSASGEASAEGGGLMFSTGEANCPHEPLLVVTDVSYSFDNEGVASLVLDGAEAKITALEPGKTKLTVQVTYSDGTSRSVTENLTVAEP